LLSASPAAPPPLAAPGEADGPAAIGGLVPDRFDATYTPPTNSTKTVSPSAQRGSPGRVGIGAWGVICSAARRGRSLSLRQRVLDWCAFRVQQEDVDQECESAEGDQPKSTCCQQPERKQGEV
jgi:hypothetical protein